MESTPRMWHDTRRDETVAETYHRELLTGHDETLADQWGALWARLGPGCRPGDWSPQEMARAEAIFTAERARQDDLREMREWIPAAYARVDAAATVVEALNLASFVGKDLERWAHTRPGPDDAGLRWLIAAYERAARAGPLICPSVDGDEDERSER